MEVIGSRRFPVSFFTEGCWVAPVHNGSSAGNGSISDSGTMNSF